MNARFKMLNYLIPASPKATPPIPPPHLKTVNQDP